MSRRRPMTTACLMLVRRIVPSLRAGATERQREPTCPSGAHPDRYIDEMTREELLSELVAEHNATVSPRARRLSDGGLRMLLKFPRWRASTMEARAATGGVSRLPQGPGGWGAQPSASE